MDTPAGRYVLAGGSTSDWADYGRWFALRQLLATTPGGHMDLSDQRVMGSLARQLGFSSAKRCREWVERLASCGGLDREAWEERGWALEPDVWEQCGSYVAQCERNRRNREARRAASDDEKGTTR